MKLSQAPELLRFLNHSISEGKRDSDPETALSFSRGAPAERLASLIRETTLIVAAETFPVEEFGSEANRWFADETEGRAWLTEILKSLTQGNQSEADGDPVVKDSNGAVLTEGDSVQVIKDLKVKGGTSDLKRGTLVKKIHLIGEKDLIECRVDGSTLVLKTCFLKKVSF
ncbi:MAG: alkylphosphonate utilization protein [Cryobacterium sp.]|nr:alkylphosphonate utilization protein [Oligoflexia bacterium]